VFDAPMYVSSSLVITFSRQEDIRRKSNDFEDILKEKGYQQPQMLSVPDDFDPKVPRFVFISQDGPGQIAVSQINITLSANYPSECRADATKAKEYMTDKSHILCSLIEIFEEVKLHYFGLTSVIRLRSDRDDSSISRICTLLQSVDNKAEINDISVKVTSVVSERFFSNITLKNYRVWQNIGSQRLSNTKAMESGIEILVDFNDRYRYNEDLTYSSEPGVVKEIVEGSFNEISRSIEKIGD